MMGLLCSSSSLQMALTAWFYFMVVLTSCSTKECRLLLEEKLKDRNAFLTKADIKLIQIECMEKSCHQEEDESDDESKIKKTHESSVHQEDQPKVHTELCGSVICNQISKCVKNGHRKICEEATPSPADRRLYSASKAGYLQRVTRILAAGHADINTRGGFWSRTPVMVAVWWGHYHLVEFLVGKGADVSLVDMFDNNVLHLACYTGHLETVKLILSLNVLDINARNSQGETAADKARYWRHPRVLDLLVSRGAH